MTTRRKFLKGAAVAAPAALATPAIAQSKIKWRMQTYAGPALAEHVIKPQIDQFNKIAGDEMEIELYFADQLVPTGELFRAMQKGTIDAVHEMLVHPLAAFGLSDAGAHCRFICDGGVHTYMLSHWVRDLAPDHPHHLPLEFVVRKLTGDNARLYGLHDRGVLEPGRRADINLIDLPRLGSLMPEMAYDLPADQPRLLCRATGYVAGYVAGELVQANGELTGARPGRVIRAT